ncbi:MAG TPA: SCO family protein [Acidimicrobiia bacterium]
MRHRALILALISVLAVAACRAPVTTDQLQGVKVENPTPKPEFTLTDTEGSPYDFAEETEGKVALLYFGYTSCPDICPTHMAQIAEVLEQYPQLEREVEVVFVTVDPERDTPERLRQYLDSFHPSFVGLTGTPEELEAAQRAANVPVATFDGEGPDYTVNHAAYVIAYAPDGLSHSIYPFGTRQAQWNNDLRVLAEMG